MPRDVSPNEAPPPDLAGGRYRAFISYSHADKKFADWLHHALETYRVPPKLVGTTTKLGVVPRRLTPIFRDRDELSATHDLSGALTAALGESMFLVVICSPASARSRWVAEEIRAFKRLRGEHRVLAVIAAGEPGDAEHECFPAALRFVLDADGAITAEPAHPIAADIREGKDGRQLGKLKLVAGLTGVRLDDVVQREAQRRVRRLTRIAVGAGIGMTLAAGLAVYANIQRIEAVHQRQIADRESAAARASSDFLIGTFSLTNPATEDPRKITAFSILEKGAAKIQTDLAGQPDTQARMLRTVGSAYNNLGLSGEAQAVLEQSLPALRRAGPQGAAAMEQLAFAYIAEAKLKNALATVNEAERQLGLDQKVEPEIRGRLERARSRILFEDGDPRGGLKAIDHALALFRAAPNVPLKSVAKALQAKGMAQSDDGQFEAANRSLTEALALMRKASGDHDIATAKFWWALAMNDMAADHLVRAEAHIDQALSIETKVLTEDNPQLADDTSLKGQILQAEHKPAAAVTALTRAIDIYKRVDGKPHYQIGIALVYLALAEAELGHTALALADFDEAKHNYDVGYGKLHPNHGDLLVNRATVLAKAGRRAEALSDCVAGLNILDQTLGADAAFTKADAKTCAAL